MLPKKPSIQFHDYGGMEIIEGTVSHTFPLHIHNAACFGIITDGSVLFYCGGKQLLKKGDTFFIPRGVPHTFAAINKLPYSYRTICIKYTQPLFTTDEFLSGAFGYMLKQAEQMLNIEELASHMGYSKYYMLHHFKDKCGLSPYQIYIGMRIAKIKQGLHNSESLLDLTHQYGFSHQSHICNVFKKHMGISPMRYRESYYSYISAGENVASI